MSEETNNSVDSIIDDLFSGYTTDVKTEVTLPSKGIGYSNNTGKVFIKIMTFDDEKAIAEAGQSSNIIDLLISRCVPEVDIDELYNPDKLFLLFKIRELSYGTKVKLDAPCKFCNNTNNLEIDLSELPIDYVDDSFTPVKEIVLPDLGKTIKIRLPRSADSGYMDSKSNIFDNLWRFVVQLDKYTDPPIIVSAIKKMSSKDLRRILEVLNTTEFGLQNEARFICSSCKKENLVAVPIAESFFTVS